MTARTTVWAAKQALCDLLAAALPTALVQLHLPTRQVLDTDRVYILGSENMTSTPADQQGTLRETYEVHVLCESQRPGPVAADAYTARDALVDALDALLVADDELGGAVGLAYRSGMPTETTNPLSDNTGWISKAIVTVHCEAFV